MAVAVPVTLPPIEAPPEIPAGIELVPLSPTIGTEVLGIDLRTPLTQETYAFLDSLLLARKVIFFRDQDITPQQHLAFARHWGELLVTPFGSEQHAESADIMLLRNDGNDQRTNLWHSDGCWRPEPELGSVLRGVLIPDVGGDTLFADMYLAYELLSDSMKTFLEGLKAVHDGAGPYVGHYKTEVPEGGYPKTAHPVIAVHPVTGRKVLNVNAAFTTHIVGLRQWESKAILEAIYTLIATTPKLWCRVNWTPNTVALWDNRCTQHHAVWDYYPYSRYGERIAIVGDAAPVSVSG